jgi:hypothetical protein
MTAAAKLPGFGGPRLKMAAILSSRPSQPKTRGLRARSDVGMGSWRLGTTKMVAFDRPIAAFPDWTAWRKM